MNSFSINGRPSLEWYGFDSQTYWVVALNGFQEKASQDSGDLFRKAILMSTMKAIGRYAFRFEGVSSFFSVILIGRLYKLPP